MGGKPSLRYEATEDGTDLKSTFVFAFVGLTEYAVNCQSTSENAAEIEEGCDQIVRTFTVDS